MWIRLWLPDGEYDNFGVEQCRRVLETVSNMLHIQQSGMNFDPRLAHRYMNLIKEAIMAGIWKGLCPKWFMLENNAPLKAQDDKLVSFLHVVCEEMDSFFHMKFENGQEHNVRLHEQNVYGSFYSNPEIYSIAKPPSCALLDIVLAKGGPEAITESFYSAMRAQQQSGGQLNETLARRTKLNWCLPSLKYCNGIISESVRLYLKLDVMRSHRQNTFFSGRAQEYSTSKVVDRVDSVLGRCPFLATV